MHFLRSRIFWIVAGIVALWLSLFVLTLIGHIADAADRIHTGAGQPVFWSLIALLVATVLAPTVWLLQMPRALRYPAAEDPQAMQTYRTRLRAHLATLPQLAHLAIHTDDEVHHALEQLRSEAEAETRRTAAAVLTSTALLQNGKLDGLVVLISQVQLVWRIARIYGLRPSPRQMSYLYGNVGASVLIASGIEEVDFAELTAPIVQAATPAAVANIPGLGGIGNLLTNSLASGSANAFLTLRVGLIAQAYCAPEHAPQRATIKHNAALRAAQLLGVIMKDCGTHISQAVYGRIKHSIVSTAQAAADSVKHAGRSVSDATHTAYQATTQGLGQAVTQVKDSTITAGQRLQQSLKRKDKK